MLVIQQEAYPYLQYIIIYQEDIHIYIYIIIIIHKAFTVHDNITARGMYIFAFHNSNEQEACTHLYPL